MFDQTELVSTLYNPTESTSTDSPQHATYTDADLPAHDNDWYEAFIYTKSLGVVFFNTSQLLSSLFLNMNDSKSISILKNRPVVSFLVEGSPACHAGIQIGFVLIKVNGYPVENSIHAMQLIKSVKERPLSLLFYRPDVELCVNEGVYFTCYDCRDCDIPKYESRWKMKYVVVGGVISKPYFLSMYRSKAEYDIAVIEIQSLQNISVKVKQFDLKDSKIIIQSRNDCSNFNGDEGGVIGKVSYSNDSKPIYYFVISPFRGCPIKIASTNLSQLVVILNAVKKVNEIY